MKKSQSGHQAEEEGGTNIECVKEHPLVYEPLGLDTVLDGEREMPSQIPLAAPAIRETGQASSPTPTPSTLGGGNPSDGSFDLVDSAAASSVLTLD